MRQPALDLMNYTPEYPSGRDHQDVLCSFPKTEGRFGFSPSDRFFSGQFVSGGLTPYGMNELEKDFITMVRDFECFNYTVMRALAESCLPDIVVLNIVENAMRIRMEEAEGQPHQYTLTHFGYMDNYTGDWRICGCNVLIEWSGRRKIFSIDRAQMLESTGRLTVVPFTERFIPRDECYRELQFRPSLAATDITGRKLCLNTDKLYHREGPPSPLYMSFGHLRSRNGHL